LKKLSALLVVLALTLGLSTSFAQPQFTIHLKGGYNLPMPQLKGEAFFYDTEKDTYGMKMGYGFGADAKYYLGKKRNVGITLDLGYNMFSNSVDSTVAGTSYTAKRKLNFFQAGLGVEYAFMPKGKVNPFIGAAFTGNFFSGNALIDPAPTDSLYAEQTLKSASRFGAKFGAGLDFVLSKSIGIVVGINYDMTNLIGKDTTLTGLSTNEFGLNDKEYSYTIGTTTTTVAAKNINYLSFYAGVSFYLNQPKKTAKK
jgi:outer membrane protein W